jgi:hypothetical protein
MKLTLLTLFLAAAITALPNADALPNANAEPSLEKRACSHEKGCRSKIGVKDGIYCGYCPQVLGTWVSNHAYQLNGDSGKAGCCDYGVRESCRDTSKYQCPV